MTGPPIVVSSLQGGPDRFMEDAMNITFSEYRNRMWKWRKKWYPTWDHSPWMFWTLAFEREILRRWAKITGNPCTIPGFGR